jgi:membrane-bound lytic murein transglycosylase D
VWEGRQLVPKGYRLRLPADAKSWTSVLLAQQLDAKDQYINQPRARSYRVRKGDSLVSVAKRNGVTVAALASINDLAENAALRPRVTLRLPDLPATRVAQVQTSVAANEPAATPTPDAAAKINERLAEQRAEARAVAQRQHTPEPVTASEARAESPSLAPGGAIARTSESIDYAISDDNRIMVAAEETLGHYAQWLNVSASRLRSLNRLSPRAAVPLGRQLTLDFSKATREQFDTRRREFHEALQATFFAAHRIVGTQVYVTRRGDSLWLVAQRYGGMPAWLVLHYNPDIDFNALRAGLEIVIPKVEALSPA